MNKRVSSSAGKTGTTQAPAAPAAAPATAVTSSSAPKSDAETDKLPPEALVLLGSSTLGSLIEIGDRQAQLGEVVAAAHAASGLSVEDWNGLTEEARDELLQAQIDVMREAAVKRDSNGQGDAKDQKVKAVFPRKVQVSNHGPIAIVEPFTGAFIQPGGKATITLRDEEHAHNVGENLRAVLAQNYLPDSALEFEDLAD